MLQTKIKNASQANLLKKLVNSPLQKHETLSALSGGMDVTLQGLADELLAVKTLGTKLYERNKYEEAQEQFERALALFGKMQGFEFKDGNQSETSIDNKIVHPSNH
jgi:uncharacterized protein HemY